MTSWVNPVLCGTMDSDLHTRSIRKEIGSYGINLDI